jgi:hypothetical protein
MRRRRKRIQVKLGNAGSFGMTSLISRVTMPYRKPINPRKASPGLVIGAFALVMTACVLAASALNLMHERDAELQRGRIDIQNLAHSLAENAAHTIQAPDIAMTGMMDLLRYQNPLPERFNKHLSDIVAVLPQVREMGVLNVDGGWRYWSVQQTPAHNNADRPTLRSPGLQPPK